MPNLPRPARALFLPIFILACLAPAVQGQPARFGSADDPYEQWSEAWWRPQSTLDVMGGLSLIGAQWRGASRLMAQVATRPFTARLGGVARAGVLSDYRADFDETYDALRLLAFLRTNTSERESDFYLRLGPIQRQRLGTGHLVDFYRSDMAWDDRTVGIETYQAWSFGEAGAFTDNVLFNGVVGGYARLQPLAWAPLPSMRSVSVGFGYVTDLQTHTRPGEALIGYNVDVQFDAFRSGEIRLRPFASFAWYEHHGSGLALGGTLESPNFLELARFHARMVLYYDGEEFIPGYIGSFYTVSNSYARILNADGKEDSHTEGVLLRDARGGNGFATDLRLLIFDRFEFWFNYRRHYGTQALSEYHLRLFARSRDRFQLATGIDRAGLRGFITLFNDLGDQTALVFETDYRVAGAFWVFIDARYTYEPRANAEDGTQRFLVQRRFEPFAGFRIRI